MALSQQATNLYSQILLVWGSAPETPLKRRMIVISFVIGFMVGGAFGVILMALLNAAKYEERIEEE